MFKIGLDAMGGDFAPEQPVLGAYEAVEKFNDIEILLYGQADEIKKYMKEPHERIKIVHCEEVIPMDIKDPAMAIRKYKDSSMVRACKDAKAGEIDAVVSAGATGALIAAGTLVVKRLKEVERPALAPVMPTIKANKYTILCDAGATSEAKPQYLYQNAKIASIYAKEVLHIQNPSVALLNIGTEEGKGTDLQKEAFKLIQADSSINFVGNMEGKTMISGEVDIIVADGYSGNIALKAVEGTSKSVFSLLKEELMSSTRGKVGALILKPIFSRIKKRMDASEVGGAMLLGVTAPVIKAHGSSDSLAIMNAIRQAREAVSQDVVNKISQALRENVE
ncbi:MULTISPECIES: phosphate acyltransferase PlsX [Turicibacter]|jgi:fatty acid/phospholipid synthesis protein plsX|uniref:Phosphate acyltransferase n=3 Tax=Turicibacter TaxID=191303 RepID=A0A173QZL2_9FIRM|nr:MULTISPECIES: phosphate acyltransferase PlsX [Turicibacter]EFF63314.1 fatty acid/phospholipid synthesis protein PlsX [Turicibacter sanguinis PC909]MBP3903413.1 phosphate acyltransferase PlsX [Turicibacter sp.]MCU7190717.1 phosphate acyltransferase PlsX [Turicibacter sanguinis]MCU7196239.1 phosphate acyltransferase PlsX [Turicibacter sanguinis]MCU7201230.1 phosphate acyltransferase PlsX [Turicibacter sanguinis]